MRFCVSSSKKTKKYQRRRVAVLCVVECVRVRLCVRVSEWDGSGVCGDVRVCVKRGKVAH